MLFNLKLANKTKTKNKTTICSNDPPKIPKYLAKLLWLVNAHYGRHHQQIIHTHVCILCTNNCKHMQLCVHIKKQSQMKVFGARHKIYNKNDLGVLFVNVIVIIVIRAIAILFLQKKKTIRSLITIFLLISTAKKKNLNEGPRR